MKELAIVSIGEILIDFVGTEPEKSLLDVSCFRRAAGGGPANMAVAAARLGLKTAFIGKVGADAFGWHLAQTLENNAVNTEGLIIDPAADTTLVFVALDRSGVPDFSFFRHGTADTLLRPDELPENLLQNTRILHFSSVSLTVEPARSACLQAVKIAREAGALISFDPNLRLPLWPDRAVALEVIGQAIELADILKMNEEEYQFFTGKSLEKQYEREELYWNDRLLLLAVTRGENGAVLFNGEDFLSVPAFPVQVVDTTGAGDAFMAGLLAVLYEQGAGKRPDRACLAKVGAWASAAAALTCQKPGGIPALPDRKGVMELAHER